MKRLLMIGAPVAVVLTPAMVAVVNAQTDLIRAARTRCRSRTLSVPTGFAEPDTEYKVVVVAAVEAGGNQTLTELSFTAG